MSAIEKTKKIQRKDIKTTLLEPNPNNPNKMDGKMFNMLYDNIETVGFIDPIFVVPHPDPKQRKKGMHRIIGGEHRWEVAKLLGFENVPCTIVDDQDFDEDLQTFQVVRQNIIHGKMTPDSFTKAVNSLSDKYTEEVFAEMFGFVDEEEFKKLLKATGDSLPKELKADFEESKKEIKTIDDLSTVLNKLFTNYGDTLPHGYMLIDFGGKDSIWLRLLGTAYNDFLNIATVGKDNRVAMDTIMSEILHLISNGKKIPPLKTLVAGLDKIPENVEMGEEEIVTLDFLDD
jgi:hypothetical protein